MQEKHNYKQYLSLGIISFFSVFMVAAFIASFILKDSQGTKEYSVIAGSNEQANAQAQNTEIPDEFIPRPAPSESSFGVPSASATAAPISLQENEYAQALRTQLNIGVRTSSALEHGQKNAAEYHKYIVVQDINTVKSSEEIVGNWTKTSSDFATHFLIGDDGYVVQAVNMDAIAHHSNNGTKGANEKFHVKNDSRDSRSSSVPDAGMDAYSVGIGLVHREGKEYTEAQLQSLDFLIRYIDAHYGIQADIISLADWRESEKSSNQFVSYVSVYQSKRAHK
ncbi:MAG: N-acetylmuramoyl-L-alanine amidase [Actinomycetaceae bacterium]|nr:N-acetylmuramoyl-L-alanine amidase [Actinomycetaceae bacterium]